jgi:hypothetical protein
MGFIRGWIGGKYKVNDGVDRTVFDEAGYLYQRDTKVTATGAQLNACKMETVLFTEAGAGTYNGTVALPAGSIIVDIIIHGAVLWAAATSAVMKVGDAVDDDGFFTGVNLKATDLLAGESISFAHAGGKQGADVDVTAAGAHVRRRWLATARNIIGSVTSVGAGTAGRTYMTVIYTTPTLISAVKA